MKTPRVTLSNDDALILQQISESGEEDLGSLASSLNMKRGRVQASLDSLRRKGLIDIQRTAGEWWVNISSRGKALMQYIWSDSAAMSY